MKKLSIPDETIFDFIRDTLLVLIQKNPHAAEIDKISDQIETLYKGVSKIVK